MVICHFAIALVAIAALWSPAPARAEYERPVSAAPIEEDIGGGYVTPSVQAPLPRAAWWAWVDAGLLAAGLGAAGWLAIGRRSRAGLVVLTVGSLAYFGFYRQGCVCPIGAIQNVVVAMRDPAYTIPLVVVLFFFMPLVAALIAGRVFCSGVCPLGAIQELVVLRPVQVPPTLDRVLRVLPFVYLAAAIGFALLPADRRDFIICRFDPFVGLFRLSGPGYMLIVGGLFLIAGVFIGRPYCRWLCPYGALLSLASRLSWRPVSITPDKELDCGLCTQACPYGAIEGMRAKASSCLACARCYGHCPRHRVCTGIPVDEPAQERQEVGV